jgi:hydrogenase expression/formation protein HypE
VNDLAVAGAVPRYLTLNAFIEEGMELAQLERLVDAMAQAAQESGVQVVAGDTKVVGRGEADGVYLDTTGVGVRADGIRPSMEAIRQGDTVLVSGPVGSHGAAVLLARGEFGFHGELRSDAASVLAGAQALCRLPGLRFMRDPTRGGLATVVNEVARATGLGIYLQEMDIPVEGPVSAVCELLGYDPLYLACEGRIVAVMAPEESAAAVAELTAAGMAPAVIGEIIDGPAQAMVRTALGGERVLEELEDDPLPRIC